MWRKKGEKKRWISKKNTERERKASSEVGRQAAAYEGPTWQVGVKAEGASTGLGFPVSSPEATQDPKNSYAAATARWRTTPIAVRTRRHCKKADPRVGDGGATLGMSRRSHVVPGSLFTQVHVVIYHQLCDEIHIASTTMAEE